MKDDLKKTKEELVAELERLRLKSNQQEARLNEMQNLSKIGYWDLNLRTNELYWSNEIFRIFDLDPQHFEATYEAFLDAIHPDDREFVNNAYTNSVKNKEPYNIVHRILLKNDTLKFVNEICETFYDDAGTAIRSIGTVRDITRRKQTEDALKESEKNLRALFSAMDDIVLEIDADGRIIDIAPTSAEQMYIPPQNALGKTVHEIFPKKEATLFFDFIKTSITEQKTKTIQYPLVINDKTNWFEGKASPKTNTTVLFIARNINESKQIEEDLKMAHARFLDVLEKMNDAFVSIDRNWCYTYMNEKAGEIFNRDPKEMIGKHIWTEFPEGIGQPFHLNYEKAMNEKVFVQMEDYYPPYNKWFENRINPTDEGIAIFFTDITERKQKEEKLKAAQQQLVTSNQQLQAAEQQLRAANQQLKANNQQLVATEKELRKEKLFSEKIVETSNAIIIGLDKKHIIKLFNRGAEQITGYKKEEVLGKDWFKLFFPKETLDEMEKVWGNLWSTDVYPYINPIRTKTNKERIISWQNTGLYNGVNHSKTLLISIGEDITERKRAEEELKESELKFQKMITESFAGISVVNEEGKITIWNNALEKITGIKKTETIDQYIWDVQTKLIDHEETNTKKIKELKSTLLDVLKTGKAPWLNRAMERDYIHPDGTVKTVSGRMYTIKTQKGYLLVSVSNDITEQKLADKALKEAQSNLQALLDNRIDSIWSLDRNYNYLVYNKPYADVISSNMGIRLEKGMNALEIHPKEVNDFWKPKFDEVFNGSYVTFEFSHLLDGKEHFFEVFMNPIYTEGKITGLSALSMNITERKEIELQNQTNRKRLEEAERVGQSGNWSNEIATGKIVWSDGMYRIYGIDSQKDTINYEKLLSLIHPADRAKHNAYFEKMLSLKPGYQIENLEYRILRPDGALRWVTVRFETEFDRNNKPAKFFGTALDITERKNAETELHKLSTAVQQSPSIIVMTDTEGNLEYVNPKFSDLTGYGTKELIGQKTSVLASGEHPKTFYKEFWDTINAGNVWQGEFHNKKKNGELFWEKASVSPIKNEHGKIDNFIKVAEDITQRKRNEQIQDIIYQISNAVAKSNNPEEFIVLVKNELKKIIDTSNFYIALYDESTDSISLLHHEDQKDKIIEIPQGKTLTRYVINTKKSLLATNRIKNELVKSGELELLGADSKVWLGVPLFTKEKVTGIMALQSYDNENAYDKYDLRTLEIISHQISISLERKKAEHDLVLALEKAQESDRLKSAFLANMSHEIRTPMNGILGFTELLKEPHLTGDERDEFIKVIEKSGHRMLETINDIVNISKIEAGQVKVVKTEVSVNHILEEQFHFFQPEAKAKGLELIYLPSLWDNEARIVTDQHKLEGILTNLIKNAIKYTKKGSITFGCKLKKEKDIKNLEFYVKDTGIGIPANRIGTIFNRLEQADIEDTRVYEGSGLGLAISKSYVEMLDGNIQVQSKEGFGSTFTFSIPYIQQNIEEISKEGNLENGEQTAFHNLSVIIAEDDEISTLFFKNIFSNLFHKIMFASSGEETIRLCRENPDTDVILMDIKMPGMSGYEATREIRKFNNDVVIIAQTAFGLSGDWEKAINAGCNDYIAKPINKEELFEKIRACLKN